jgi:hypothetical protein
MALEKRKPVLKPKTVKPYVTKEGTVVLSHQERFRTLDKEKRTKGHTDSNVFPLKEAPEPIIDHKHSTLVYNVQGFDGTSRYFKPIAGEKWGVEKEEGFKPYRQSILDDRLAKKEVLAFEVSKALQMDSIPETTLSSIKHPGHELGEGSLQRDVVSSLSSKGFGSEALCFWNWESLQIEKHKNARPGDEYYKIKDIDRKHIGRERTLQNGGMDLAFFDYIIGNSDRHGNNYFVGKNDRTKSFKIMGIDHGLSFPNETKFSWRDYKTSMLGLWNHAAMHGKNVDCSEAFKKVIMDPSTQGRLEKVLSGSVLTAAERTSTMERFGHVKDQLMKSRKLTGVDLMQLLKSNLKTS